MAGHAGPAGRAGLAGRVRVSGLARGGGWASRGAGRHCRIRWIFCHAASLESGADMGHQGFLAAGDNFTPLPQPSGRRWTGQPGGCYGGWAGDPRIEPGAAAGATLAGAVSAWRRVVDQVARLLYRGSPRPEGRAGRLRPPSCAYVRHGPKWTKKCPKVLEISLRESGDFPDVSAHNAGGGGVGTRPKGTSAPPTRRGRESSCSTP